MTTVAIKGSAGDRAPPIIRTKSLWTETLTRATRDYRVTTATCVVLGKQGKSNILKQFRDRVANKDTAGFLLDYSYSAISLSEDEEAKAYLNIYHLDEPSHFDILNQPSTLFTQFKSWTEGLKKVTEALMSKLPLPQQKELKQKISRIVQFSDQKDISEETRKLVEDSSIPPINLGVPVMVVGINIDSFPKGIGVSEEISDRFEAASRILREKCLEYGASLIYTTVGSDMNLDVIRDYILYHVFENSELRERGFKHTPRLFSTGGIDDELDLIFIPSGFDSLSLIDEGHTGRAKSKFNRQTSIETLLPKPKDVKQKQDQEVKATDDQIFLKTLQFITENQQKEPGIEKVTTAPRVQPKVQDVQPKADRLLSKDKKDDSRKSKEFTSLKKKGGLEKIDE